MREILFKAKRIDNDEWVEGNLFFLFQTKAHEAFIIPIKFGNAFMQLREGDLCFRYWYKVDPETICQFTGLTDKNGNKIWENDICDRKEKYPEVVKMINGDWTLDYSYVIGRDYGNNYCNLGFYVTERKCVEVIGNIFDNPELLQEVPE